MLLLEFLRIFSDDTMVVIRNKDIKNIYHGPVRILIKEADSDTIKDFIVEEAFIRHNTLFISEMR